jgi:DNA-directed RNA polymerase subunit RPC12/RpoP
MATKDELELPIECPGCSKKVSKSVRELVKDPSIACECGARIRLPDDTVKQMAAALDNLDKSLGRLKKLGK